MKLTIEIHPAEGGDDAKALVSVQESIYKKYAVRHTLKFKSEYQGPICFISIDGPDNLTSHLLTEAGGHRWQRVPPNERKGRIHTSAVTVAVFESDTIKQAMPDIKPSDIVERVTRGTGPGGQNRNKRETAIVLKHIPTGIEVKSECERTQDANRKLAMAELTKRVTSAILSEKKNDVDSDRKSQLGGGARGDKIRSYRSDGVIDHITNRKAQLNDILAGKLELLYA